LGGFIDKDGPQFPDVCQRFVKAEDAEGLAADLAQAHAAYDRMTETARDAQTRISQLEAELAQWQRMRNEAMAQAIFNRNEIEQLRREMKS
jgi:hypothetical protein